MKMRVFFNSLSVLVIFCLTLCLAHFEGYLPLFSASYWTLGITATSGLFLARHLPVSRFLLLILFGALTGIGTEETGVYSGLWSYSQSTYLFAIAFYSLSPLASYSLLLVIHHFLSKVLPLRSSRWPSRILVLIIFSAIGADLSGYANLPFVLWAYYGLLFFIAISGMYYAKFSLSLSAILAGAIVGMIGQYAGGPLDKLWIFSETPSFVPAFLVLGVWPLEFLSQFSLSGILSDILRKAHSISDIHLFAKRSLNKLASPTPEVGQYYTLIFSVAAVALAIFSSGSPSFCLIFFPTMILALFISSYLATYRLFWLLVGGSLIFGSLQAAGGKAGLLLSECQSFLFPFFGIFSLCIYGLYHYLSKPLPPFYERTGFQRLPLIAACFAVFILIAAGLFFPQGGYGLILFLVVLALVHLIWFLSKKIPGSYLIVLFLSSAICFSVIHNLCLWDFRDRGSFFFFLSLQSILFIFLFASSAYLSSQPLIMKRLPAPKYRGRRVIEFIPKKNISSSIVACAQGEGSSEILLSKAIELLGGMSKFVKPGQTVFIKPNIMMQVYDPYTTSPESVRCLAKLCLEAGATKVIIGETSISDISACESLRFTGLAEYWESLDSRVRVVCLDEDEFVQVELKTPLNNPVIDRIQHLPKLLLDSDLYINISKMKTHVITDVTLCIKNSLGLHPDKGKAKHHGEIEQKLVDIVKARPPDLSIVEGFYALEANGPWCGKRVDAKTVVASADIVAADAVASYVMGREPLEIKTTRLANDQGLGNARDPIIETGGAPLKRYNFLPPSINDEKLAENVGKIRREHPTRWKEAEFPYLVGRIRLVADEEDRDSLTLLMMVLSFMEPVLAPTFVGELLPMTDYAIVYGPLKYPLEADGAILFGDRAIASEHLVFAPRILYMPGVNGGAPNQLMKTFEELSQQIDLDLVRFLLSSILQSRGDYW
ncbi:MAG: DUF362 domain-containing protein [bacterium]